MKSMKSRPKSHLIKKKKKAEFLSWLSIVTYISYCSFSSDKKEFDAFVSYAKWSSLESEATSSPTEESLALNLFPEVLENRYGYTLCLLERDVAPGGGRSCTPEENRARWRVTRHDGQ